MSSISAAGKASEVDTADEVGGQSVTRAAIVAHHRQLTDTLSEQVALLEQGKTNGDELAGFLKGELLPHAAGEEQHLYPVMDDLIRKHASATATMRVDHEYIANTARQIEETTQALGHAPTAEEQARLRARLIRLATQLDGVLRLHVEKEERVYLPLFGQYLPAEKQQHILDAMHETADAADATETHHAHNEQAAPADGNSPGALAELDVRPLPPAQRHALIFRTFDELATGTAFILINDHDPKPLYYQLNAERPGQLVWEYLEEGPSQWRVSIGRAG